MRHPPRLPGAWTRRGRVRHGRIGLAHALLNDADAQPLLDQLPLPNAAVGGDGEVARA